MEKIYKEYDTTNVSLHLKKYTVKYDSDKVELIKNYYNDSKSYIKTMKEFNIKNKSTLFYILKNR
jgi:hypothetical protein